MIEYKYTLSWNLLTIAYYEASFVVPNKFPKKLGLVGLLNTLQISQGPSGI